ncbi:MAG: DUF2490 domain-containing protein [Muricauda sp.]|jgi:hypothetical protein|nr:DUF2490 domain-containing protein [Allomuricauda sp.]MBO6534100.1 DUF2490 domain-containing protein [Allomuricauda sp.]MBO6588952.1 DUF2490 domain-containing protein [Allomuricauda sp.]MBO6618577.1 DUF2490 domain-containing protein [Allomuricauda sp.]MBO6644490.1 DUF2490 domain-containing protein [Allomuricauda sp.]MBO6746390.1 DUF2490 domain-containing protein [Allomuricauda sp.]
MIKRLLTLVFLTGALSANLHAQTPGEEELGAWFMYFGTNQIAERFSIHSEAQFRYYETTDNFNQMLLRTGLNYHINPDAMATIGYAFIQTDTSFEDIMGEVDSRENRIFQQFILRDKVWEFLFEHRYRLEQRFFDFGDVTDTQHRARYRIQVTLPLTDTFFLNFYDELFINLQDNLFDQNRLYAAFGVNITENSNIQLGYLRNQFANAVFDRLQFAVFYNPDLRGLFKKKRP